MARPLFMQHLKSEWGRDTKVPHFLDTDDDELVREDEGRDFEEELSALLVDVLYRDLV